MYDEETAYHLREIQSLSRDNDTLRDRLVTASTSHHSAQPANGHANEIQVLTTEIAELKRQKSVSERDDDAFYFFCSHNQKELAMQIR